MMNRLFALDQRTSASDNDQCEPAGNGAASLHPRVQPIQSHQSRGATAKANAGGEETGHHGSTHPPRSPPSLLINQQHDNPWPKISPLIQASLRRAAQRERPGRTITASCRGSRMNSPAGITPATHRSKVDAHSRCDQKHSNDNQEHDSRSAGQR